MKAIFRYFIVISSFLLLWINYSCKFTKKGPSSVFISSPDYIYDYPTLILKPGQRIEIKIHENADAETFKVIGQYGETITDITDLFEPKPFKPGTIVSAEAWSLDIRNGPIIFHLTASCDWKGDPPLNSFTVSECSFRGYRIKLSCYENAINKNESFYLKFHLPNSPIRATKVRIFELKEPNNIHNILSLNDKPTGDELKIIVPKDADRKEGITFKVTGVYKGSAQVIIAPDGGYMAICKITVIQNR